jgi:hypothetical protein
MPDRIPAEPQSQPEPRECNTCRYEGQPIDEWPCRTSLSAAGLMCWESKANEEGTHEPL